MDILDTAILVLALLLSAAGGWWFRSRLHERHLTGGSLDSIRLLISMLLTFAALVLGLLTSNAKQRFDGLGESLNQFSTDLIELDHRLRVYGPEADVIRKALRSYTAAAIADSWPDEQPPLGDYPQFHRDRGNASIENDKLGQMLSDIDVQIERLTPTDDFHIRIAARLRDRVATSIQQRWRLIFSARPSISWPFLLMLTSWLCIVFAIFGLTSPPGIVVCAVTILSALSIASPLYLILDYNQAIGGRIMLSSTPMRAALTHMDQPETQ